MSRAIAFISTTALAIIVLVAACSDGADENVSTGSGAAPHTTTTKAIVQLAGTKGNEAIAGKITFTQQEGGVLVEATVAGLAAGKHGFHIHQLGDVTCLDGKCTKGHWNPTGAKHGGPDAAERHHGDLGTLEAGADGKATYKRVDKMIQRNGHDSIVGRGIIIHAGADDLTSQPTGAAGARVAQGVIGIAEEK